MFSLIYFFDYIMFVVLVLFMIQMYLRLQYYPCQLSFNHILFY